MPYVLITGMSGVGKSTVLAELARRGFRVVDTDDGDWIEQARTESGPGEPLWRENLMDALLAGDDDSVVFVAGCVANQGSFYPRFEAVVLLTAPLDVILERVRTRTTNPFGKAAGERERIVDDVHAVEPLLRQSADLVIDTRAPVSAVVSQLLDLVPGTAPVEPTGRGGWRFVAELWLYPGEAGWHFVTLPADVADEIDEVAGERAGFGSVPVEVTVGASIWRTSVFPDRKSASFVLPVKKAVRAAEGLEAGTPVTISLRYDADRAGA